MKVVVTGATGLLGRHLVSALASRGDSVVALSRRQGWVGGIALTPWDPATGLPLPEGVDAIVNLAGESVGERRWTEPRKLAIRNSRILVTRRCAEASHEGMALVSASAVGYYAETDEALDEDAPPGSDFLAEVCVAWEAEAASAERRGARVVRLRAGTVIAADGKALSRLIRLTRVGLGGPLGGGRQWWSWIHLVDAVGMILHALDRIEVRGPMNVTSPAPVRQREFARILSGVLHRPYLMATPGFAVRAVMGEAADIVLVGHRVFPALAVGTGYRFRFPELEPALAEAIAAARADPALQPSPAPPASDGHIS